MYVNMYTCIDMHVFENMTNEWIYVYIYVCMYVNMCTYIHMHMRILIWCNNIPTYSTLRRIRCNHMQCIYIYVYGFRSQNYVYENMMSSYVHLHAYAYVCIISLQLGKSIIYMYIYIHIFLHTVEYYSIMRKKMMTSELCVWEYDVIICAFTCICICVYNIFTAGKIHYIYVYIYTYIPSYSRVLFYHA